MAKQLQVNIQNCNGTGTITKVLPIASANCLKSVGLTFKCGIAPYTVTAVIEGTTTNVGSATFATNMGTFTYNIPNDGETHNVVITVKDNTGKTTATFQRTNIKC